MDGPKIFEIKKKRKINFKVSGIIKSVLPWMILIWQQKWPFGGTYLNKWELERVLKSG
jgi:hypothetical protein